MGAKDSKPSFISYEDAVKRVSDSELRRIREAFKRCAGANGTALSLEAFVHDVLCDGVPYEVAEWLYQTCGGTKRGIVFKDLLCGIVVLTKGNIEEKIKFLWTLYTNNQGDNGTHIYKRDFARTLHLENTSLPVPGAQRTAEILLSLFGQGDRVPYDQFRSWLLIHKDATVLSKWLLSETNLVQELETPTFYQSLAGVTHLEERDIIELEKCFWSLRTAAPTGQLDAESLGPLLSPPLPSAAVAGTFLAFDENRDGHVDFKELCCGLSAACRGPTTERLKFCFKIFDLDSDGVLNKKELINMVGILCTVANESLKNQGSRASTPDGNETETPDKGFDPEVILVNLREKLVTVPKNGKKPVFQLGLSTDSEEIVHLKEEIREEEGLIANDTVLTLEDFLIWSVESAEALVTPFSELLFEVCHIVLGLRPQCKHRERDIVLGWLRREVQRGYSVGQFWYLISSEWWAQWVAYTLGTGADTCCRPHNRHIDEAIVCDESFTTNSTESMGSLLWRAETGSVGSAGSSSGVSSAPPSRAHHHPGPIDNKRLLTHNLHKVSTLTGEGGHLRRDVTLAQHRDFELVPDALWRALALWYGGPDPLPRQVIRPPNSDVELELYPLQLMLYRHLPNAQRVGGGGGGGVGAAPGAAAETHLAYTAAFSRLATLRQVTEFLCGALALPREDLRLWVLPAAAVAVGGRVLLDDDRPALHELGLGDRARLLLELRNPDLTWPEEIGALASSRATERRDTLAVPNMPGATGLHNLGNTCFMNAALQAVWNTGPLTRYFNSGMHLYEVNPTNTLGTGGALALRFGELCKEVWSCSARSVAPLRVRWCVSRHARALAGGGQHDAQELLAWLLDALHEDLNRAPAPAPAPAAAAPAASASAPAAAAPPRPDQELAAEAWDQHRARNDSILTELFYGQLKSKVRCDACHHESVRFDTFNMLSLPLPMECFLRCEIRVMLLDGSVPVKYGVRVNSEGTYSDLKKKLEELCGLAPETMVIAELSGATIAHVMEDNAKVSPASACDLYAYEVPGERDSDSECSDCDEPHANGWCEEASQWAEVSVGRGGNTSSLCMPALFCFKRSRSEILMSQSPPNTFYDKEKFSGGDGDSDGGGGGGGGGGVGVGDQRTSTLPRDLRKAGKPGSPTMSVKSLTLKPTSPRLGKVKFSSSPSNMYKMNDLKQSPLPSGKIQYLVAVHRKQHRAEWYFLPAQRSACSVFGVPLLVPVRAGLSGRHLYALVWRLVARLLTRRPPPPHHQNHAADCDDSLGYEFPFTLRLVQGNGAWCALCAWPALCRGCALPNDDRPLVRSCAPAPAPTPTTTVRMSSSRKQSSAEESPIARSKLLGAAGALRRGSALPSAQGSEQQVGQKEDLAESGTVRSLQLGAVRDMMRAGARVMLAIDWDPTALHLRYQSTREKECKEHRSVGASRAEGARAVDLASCLSAFTGEERLEQRYHCARCRAAQPATKKLQIWRLPPVLVIHLKRFQYVNNKWIKSQKVVNFPFQEFDPTAYLASVPQETILRHMEINNIFRNRSSILHGDTINETGTETETETETDDENPPKDTRKRKARSGGRRGSRAGRERGWERERLESTSLVTTPVTDDNLADYHQHRLLPSHDQFDLKYNLYAVVSHSGQLSGGHYVAYVRNPSGAWLCYNDSSCRELTPAGVAASPDPPIDPAGAYLLFYERRGLDCDRYLPDVAGRRPAAPRPQDRLDPDENDLRKLCVIA